MDIKFEVDEFSFNVRSPCIIKDKTHKKVLLTNMRVITDHEAFLLPGGRLNLLENSQDAIKREIQDINMIETRRNMRIVKLLKN